MAGWNKGKLHALHLWHHIRDKHGMLLAVQRYGGHKLALKQRIHQHQIAEKLQTCVVQ